MSERRAGSGEDAVGPDKRSADMLAAARSELARTCEALEAARRDLEAMRAEERLLRGELQHRVRNVLAVVRSIFARSVAAAETVEDLANHFHGRLDVLGRYQFSRLHEPNGSTDLETMICDELQSFYAAGDPRIVLAGPEVRLGHDLAQAMGMAFHELATNSIKFGMLGSGDTRGQLRIDWRSDGEWLRVRWEETGVAIVARAPLRSGFGREFIEQALPYQLGAETSFELRPGGLRCDIAVPLGASAKPSVA